MKKVLVLILIMGLCVGCAQQEVVEEEESIELPASPDGSMFKGEEWYDLVETVGINRELYHSHLLPYGSVEEALSNEKSAFTKSIDNASFVVNLTGEWDFYYADNPFERLGSTWGVDWDTSDWDKIMV
ncbi:MAG: hypothetical protein HUJ56_08330, partial [Erysipelotrichaceae bacterium]|nr:hypothetical protein [Erysipelotrichaceae bacterium]